MSVPADWFALHYPTLLYALACFGVGTVAGFQGLLARIPGEYQMALRNFNGACYIALRGALPAVLYLVLHRMHLLNLDSWQEALLLGAGSESLLRSRFLILFKSTGPGQPPAEENKGVLDLVFGMQKFFLDRTASQLARQRVQLVDSYYGLQGLTFDALDREIDTVADALGPAAATARTAVALLRQEYDAGLLKLPAGSSFDSVAELRWCRKLGLKLYKDLTRDDFLAISESILESLKPKHR